MNQLPLSAVLSDIAEQGDERISIADLMKRFGGRALGALLFLFGLACLLPLPPGATTIFGTPLLLLAMQLVAGAGVPWLPESIKRQTLSSADLAQHLPRMVRWLRRLEAISKPRLVLLFSPLGERLIGVLCTALALVLILPIPFGNILPALAVSALSFSLIQRDGVIALAGYGLVATSVGVLTLAAHIVVRTFEHGWALVAAT